MTISSQQFAPLRRASRAAGNRIAYFLAGGLDPAQARSEAMATIGRTVSHQASVLGVDIFFLLLLMAATIMVALTITLGLQRTAYRTLAQPNFGLAVAVARNGR